MFFEDIVHIKAREFDVDRTYVVLSQREIYTMGRPFRKEAIVEDGNKGGCELLKGDVAFRMIGLAEVGVIVFVDHGKGCVLEFASFVVDLLVKECKVFPCCDFRCHDEGGSSMRSFDFFRFFQVRFGGEGLEEVQCWARTTLLWPLNTGRATPAVLVQ